MCDEIYDKQILEDVKFTEKDSIQFFHYEKGSIRKYDRLLKKHNLTQETRDDPSGYYHEGEALDNFTVAPIFDKDGKKICWGMYWPEPNQYRIDSLIAVKNFGLLEIDFLQAKPLVTLQVRGERDEFIQETKIKY